MRGSNWYNRRSVRSRSRFRCFMLSFSFSLFCASWRKLSVRYLFSSYVTEMADLIQQQFQFSRLLGTGQYDISTGVMHSEIVDEQSSLVHLTQIVHSETGSRSWLPWNVSTVSEVLTQEFPRSRWTPILPCTSFDPSGLGNVVFLQPTSADALLPLEERPDNAQT